MRSMIPLFSAVARLALVLILALAALRPAPAEAAYPSKPLRVIVGFTAGSSTDVATRVVAQRLGELLGQQVIVENRPGAASNIATEFVARAPNDGYTLLCGTIANTINTTLYPDQAVRFEDLTPIALMGSLPNILVVQPALGVTTVGELIALAKARPDGIAYGSSGSGTAPHLSGELFNLLAGVKLLHVPYKGSSQAVTDLLGGQIQVMFSPAPTVLPHIRAGKLTALATTGARRTAVAPDLPTLTEAGLTGFDTGVWLGLLAPPGTSRAIVDRLAAAIGQALDTPAVKERFAAQAIDVLGGGPEEFAGYIRSETEKWAKVIEMSGAKSD
jgi:tripartite-type tricarboxylate transporter receptor subunit TctC